jgi:hypothetical protein
MSEDELQEISPEPEPVDPEDGEIYFLKVLYVAEYYLLTVIVTAGFVLAYNGQLSSETSGGLAYVFSSSPEAYLGLGLLVLLLNFSLRLSGFSTVKQKHFDMDAMHDRIISFGFSFMLTIYFLFVIGVGLNVATGGFDLNGFTPGGGLLKPMAYTVFLIIMILTLAIFGEWFLKNTGVPPCLKKI